MKAAVYSMDGKKKAEVELPSLFNNVIREDIAEKYAEAEKYWQPYGIDPEAGRRHSAAGIISHKRHDWKGQYGKGISRVPRKIMWRRGVQFNWVGAEVSGTRGGRRPHGPKTSFVKKKINKKEAKLALNSGFAATAKEDYVVKRYSSLQKLGFKLPLVLESKDKIKMKQLIALLKSVFGENYAIALRQKDVRAGKGKARGRKYKANAGLLLVTGKDEKISLGGISVKTVRQVSISDLYPLGRLAAYTEKAISEMGEKK